MKKIALSTILTRAAVPAVLAALDAVRRAVETVEDALAVQKLRARLLAAFTQLGEMEARVITESGGTMKDGIGTWPDGVDLRSVEEQLIALRTQEVSIDEVAVKVTAEGKLQIAREGYQDLLEGLVTIHGLPPTALDDENPGAEGAKTD